MQWLKRNWRIAGSVIVVGVIGFAALNWDGLVAGQVGSPNNVELLNELTAE